LTWPSRESGKVSSSGSRVFAHRTPTHAPSPQRCVTSATPVIRTIADRGGVIGTVLYNLYLEPEWVNDRSIPITVGVHVRRQLEHIAETAGWSCVGIGSDLDGGF